MFFFIAKIQFLFCLANIFHKKTLYRNTRFPKLRHRRQIVEILIQNLVFSKHFCNFVAAMESEEKNMSIKNGLTAAEVLKSRAEHGENEPRPAVLHGFMEHGDTSLTADLKDRNAAALPARVPVSISCFPGKSSALRPSAAKKTRRRRER